MEKIRNILISRKQVQCDQFNKSHGAPALPELPPGQEILFRSPADDEYIPWTITEKATVLHSYIIEAQDKRYHRNREHVWLIHFNLPSPAQQQQKLHTKQCFTGPSPPKSCIPKPSYSIPSLSRPSVLIRPPLPCHLAKLPSCILCLVCTSKAGTACPSVEDLLLHLSTKTPLPSGSVQPEKPWTPSEPHPASTPPAVPKEELEAESPGSLDSQATTALFSLHPRLPITYNETALSCLLWRPQVKISNNLSIPFPSDSECNTSDDMSTDGNLSTDGDTDGSDHAVVMAD